MKSENIKLFDFRDILQSYRNKKFKKPQYWHKNQHAETLHRQEGMELIQKI